MKKSRFDEFWLPDEDEHFYPLLSLGMYQGETFGMAIPHVRRFDVAIDAGAHVGIFSRRFAKFFKRVLAFEPDWSNYQCLAHNTAQFPNVMPFRSALGSTTAESCVVVVDSLSNSGARSVKVTPDGDVPMMTIDNLHLPVGLIKIDTEGFEREVIEGARETLLNHGPALIIERPPPETIRFLDTLGYVQVGETSKDKVFVIPQRKSK